MSSWLDGDRLIMTHPWRINSMRCSACGVGMADLMRMAPKDLRPCALWVEEGL